MGILSFFGKNTEADTALKDAVSRGAFLLDVRTPAEFSKNRVEGSVNIPVDKLEQSLAKLKNKNEIVVYCQSGIRAKIAKNLLENHGFKNVINGKTWMKVQAAVQKSK